MAHPRRVAKVTSQIRRELGDMFATDEAVVKAISPGRSTDDLSAVASITAVYVSNDLQVVKAYVSIYSDARGRVRAMENLKRLEPYVRREIGSRMNLRLTPLVLFEYDDSIEEEELVERVLGAEEVRRIRSELDAEAGILEEDEDDSEEEEEGDGVAVNVRQAAEATTSGAGTPAEAKPKREASKKPDRPPGYGIVRRPDEPGPFDFMFNADGSDEEDAELDDADDVDDGHLGYNGPAPYRRNPEVWVAQTQAPPPPPPPPPPPRKKRQPSMAAAPGSSGSSVTGKAAQAPAPAGPGKR